MSTARRQLGHGPQPQAPAAPAHGVEATRRVRATEADVEAAPLYRPGGLEHIAQLRESGVLGSGHPTCVSWASSSFPTGDEALSAEADALARQAAPAAAPAGPAAPGRHARR